MYKEKSAPTDSSSCSSGGKCDVSRDLVAEEELMRMETTSLQVYNHSGIRPETVFSIARAEIHIYKYIYIFFTHNFLLHFSPPPSVSYINLVSCSHKKFFILTENIVKGK